MTETNDKTDKVIEADNKAEVAQPERHTTPFPAAAEQGKNSSEPVDDRVYEGVVVWFGASKKEGASRSTKSFGFIEWFDKGEQQKDMFIHFSDIVSEEGAYRSLKKGQKVSFQVGKNHFSEDKAVNVKVIG
jgi:cold shock CspA family protein